MSKSGVTAWWIERATFATIQNAGNPRAAQARQSGLSFALLIGSGRRSQCNW